MDQNHVNEFFEDLVGSGVCYLRPDGWWLCNTPELEQDDPIKSAFVQSELTLAARRIEQVDITDSQGGSGA